MNKAFKMQITGDEFAENILGFEEVEEDEEEPDLQDDGQQEEDMSHRNSNVMGMIPEELGF